VKNESELQSEKHSDPKISTDEGIQMDLSEMHEKRLSLQFVSGVILVQILYPKEFGISENI
jgi:hypothetical protein